MDEALFLDFYRQIAPRLRSYLHLALRDTALADDLLQEAFYRLLRAQLRDVNVHQVRSYLYKTALTLIADQRRALARERKRQEGWSVSSCECPRLDLSLDMERLFAQLPSKQQTLLWLAYVEGLSHREIAGFLGMKERSVRVALYRARRKMAEILQDHGWGPEEVL